MMPDAQASDADVLRHACTHDAHGGPASLDAPPMYARARGYAPVPARVPDQACDRAQAWGHAGLGKPARADVIIIMMRLPALLGTWQSLGVAQDQYVSVRDVRVMPSLSVSLLPELASETESEGYTKPPDPKTEGLARNVRAATVPMIHETPGQTDRGNRAPTQPYPPAA